MGGYLDSPQVRGLYTGEEFVAMVTGNLTQAVQVSDHHLNLLSFFRELLIMSIYNVL